MEGKNHILVVDNQQDMRDMLADILKEEGYRVTPVENGHEALERMQAIPFNIALVDIKMPGLSGVELIRKLKESNPGLTIIVMTGYSSPETDMEAVRAGVYDYLTKPFPAEELLLAVKRAVREQDVFAENKKLAQQIEELKKNLQDGQDRLYQSEKSANIGRLAAGVSHELKNLLGIINVVAHCLKKKVDSDDEKAVKYLQTIEKEVNHSNQLILNLLSLSRPGKDNTVLTDINELLKETLSLVEHQLSIQNIKIFAEYDVSLPQMSIESNQMKQVFTNIIFNAQEAMPVGGELHITTRLRTSASKPEDTGQAEIKFEDTGHGIAEKDLENIFKPFFSTSKREEKSGLGLPISRDIVKKHGGEIEVKSQPSVGTTFTINLPFKKKVEENKEPTNNNSKNISNNGSDIDKDIQEKVLVLMKTTPQGMKLDEIEKVLGMSRQTVFETMEQMVTEGAALKEGESYRASSIYPT